MPSVPPLPVLPRDPAERRAIYLCERRRLIRLDSEYGTLAKTWLVVVLLSALGALVASLR